MMVRRGRTNTVTAAARAVRAAPTALMPAAAAAAPAINLKEIESGGRNNWGRLELG